MNKLIPILLLAFISQICYAEDTPNGNNADGYDKGEKGHPHKAPIKPSAPLISYNQGVLSVSTNYTLYYVTQASFEWWKEHQYEMPLEGKVAPWVALDSAGAVAGGVFHCVRNWNNRLQWKDLAIDCAEGAVCASIGKFFKIG